MIAETSVIRVLHNGHQLDHIVSGCLYAREDIISKLGVRGYFPLFARHSHMRFVDKGPKVRWLLRGGIFPLVFFIWFINLGAIKIRFRILHHIARIRRNALTPPTIPAHLKAVIVSVTNCISWE